MSTPQTTAPTTPFKPEAVAINYTLNFQQVDLILKGLRELPRKETDGFYEQFRGVALHTLKAAEDAHGASTKEGSQPS